MKKNGQVLLIIILVVTVALAIGLSIIQRSLIDVSTSTKVEQSARAFSAAEAAIEKAIRGDLTGVNFTETGATATISGGNPIPVAPAVNSRQLPLEYPPLGKEEIAHVWLADPNSLTPFYTQSSIDVLWGSIDSTEKPAIEIKIITESAGVYSVKNYFLDNDSTRVGANGFTNASTGSGVPNCATATAVETALGTARNFLCRSTLTGWSGNPMVLRARFLYSSSSQAFAVQAVGNYGSCSGGCILPTQARLFTSTGTAGDTQRRVQVFRLDKVVPFYFDYAIFSAGDIDK